MSHPTFVLTNGNLTYDPTYTWLCTDEPHISYGAKVPAPVPAGRGGGGGGGGPGWPLIRFERLPIRPDQQKGLGAFAKAVAKRIRDEISKESSKFSQADPLGVIQRIPPEKVRERDLRFLRKRIQELEAEVGRLRQDRAGETAALERTVEELRRLVSDLQGKVESVGRPERVRTKYREVYRLGLASDSGEPVTVKESVLDGKALEEALTERITSAMAEYVTEPRRLVRLAVDPISGGLWKIVAAITVAAATDGLLPEDAHLLRTAGYGAAVTLAVGGVAELLRVKTKGDK